ncbi:uncharacterized protein LOC100902755 [Galendromus occidentalis]|uniref:Uncharacterized protein LOC100902755 n=1 Tax=Galendromus occidentalis TaxID=34638 RepID=A0AAJ6QY52_9ACAR|nr:uncharacterized protein LOC100902755 [Galendromus occidentalis]
MDFIATYRGRALIFVVGAALSIVYQIEKPYAWSIQETLVVNRNRDDVFTAATSEQWIAKFLPFVDSVHQVDESKPVAKNTLFISHFSIPIYGDIKNTFRVIDHSEGKVFRLFGSSPWLRPVLTVKTKQMGEKTEVTIIVTFWRNSMLFQATLAPFLWLAHQDSLRQSLLLLRIDLQD